MRGRGTVWAVLGAAALAGATLAAQQTTGITSKDVADGLKNPARWLSYSGDYTSQRYSPLTQITAANAGQIRAEWTFQTGVTGKFEATPIVIDGTMYITGANDHAWGLDAKTGKQLWHYQRFQETAGGAPGRGGAGAGQPTLAGLKVCCGLVNRGFAAWHDKLYMMTLDAHLVALTMKDGRVVWDVPLAAASDGFAGTAAPLVVKDKLIVGLAGGEYAIRGFISAIDPETGKEVWRFYTVPGPGEPGFQSWSATWDKGGGPAWLTGAYDPDLNLLYWGTGNPNPDFYGGDRIGDNLYTGSLVAIDADTGKLKWHYQFTPHDEHDWDAVEMPVLADVTIGGRQRKVVMQANRNGFFYVLDRATGEFLVGKPFVKTTWAIEIGRDGRPIELPNQRPTREGTMTCPDLYGGTNFNSPSFSPQTGLFYVNARETCMTYRSAPPPADYKTGDRTMGGSMQFMPGTGALRAIDPATGQIKWELKHPTPSWGGILTTAGGVVFTGDNEGFFIAADARTGNELYRYGTGAAIYGPPTTYTVEGRQYVLMPSGLTLTAYGLPQAR
jgi:alcohol dehydrogenase (cytochrome c)